MNSLQPAHLPGAVAVKGLCDFFLGIHIRRYFAIYFLPFHFTASEDALADMRKRI